MEKRSGYRLYGHALRMGGRPKVVGDLLEYGTRVSRGLVRERWSLDKGHTALFDKY